MDGFEAFFAMFCKLGILKPLANYINEPFRSITAVMAYFLLLCSTCFQNPRMSFDVF